MEHTILSVRFYVLIFLALIALTLLTAGLSTVDLGGGKESLVNVIAAILIACAKATLVILFFMHLKYSNRLTWAVAGGVLLWAAIAGTLTMADYLSRHVIAVGPPWAQ